jgi:hypothetical protein
MPEAPLFGHVVGLLLIRSGDAEQGGSDEDGSGRAARDGVGSDEQTVSDRPSVGEVEDEPDLQNG